MSSATLDTHAIAFPASETHGDEGLLPRPRQVTDRDWARFERYAAEMLTSFGMDLTTPGTGDTPRRFVRALFDATDGYDGDPKLLTAFPTECRGGANCELAQVVEGPIPFVGLCEHHVLPFFGRAYVGYVAHDQIIGISKLTRLVRVVTRRFGVQERMTHDIADGLAIDAPSARRRRLPRGASPVHPDARRPRARSDDPDDRLPRNVRRAGCPPAGVPRHQRHRAVAMIAVGATRRTAGRRCLADRAARRRCRASDGRARGGALPPALARRYGSDLTIGLRSDGPTIVANFVTTLDGVVAFDTMGRTGGREVSGGFAPDRFLMGLLRATADAVLVGAGTVRSGAHHVWTPDHVHPPSTAAYATWRHDSDLRRRSRRRSSSPPAGRSTLAIRACAARTCRCCS